MQNINFCFIRLDSNSVLSVRQSINKALLPLSNQGPEAIYKSNRVILNSFLFPKNGKAGH